MVDNSNLAVRLVRNDGSETFRCKAQSTETQVENGLVTDSIISAGSRAVAGGKLVLELQRYQVDMVIQGMTAGDYPNSGTYSNHDRGFRDELLRASKEWGFDASNGFDVLNYDGRQIDGVITAFNPQENAESRPDGTYEATLEWTFLDAYVS